MDEGIIITVIISISTSSEQSLIVNIPYALHYLLYQNIEVNIILTLQIKKVGIKGINYISCHLTVIKE